MRVGGDIGNNFLLKKIFRQYSNLCDVIDMSWLYKQINLYLYIV